MIKGSLFNGAYDKNAPEIIPVIKYLDRIKNGESKEKVTKLRNAKTKEQSDKLKKSFPSFVFGGVFKKRAGDTLVGKGSGLAIMDFDNVDNPEEYKTMLFNLYDTIFAAWISPSGTGVKALVRIPKVKDLREYKLRYFSIIDSFNLENTDKQTSDINRLCFESYDPKIKIREFEKTSIFEEITQEIEYTSPPVLNGKADSNSKRIFDRLVNGISSSKTGPFKEGNRNHFIYALSCDCNNFGIDKNEAIDYMSLSFQGYFKEDFTGCMSTINQGYKNIGLFGSKSMEADPIDDIVNGFKASTDTEPSETVGLEFPLHIFPVFMQNFIIDLRTASLFPIDYSATSFISAISGIIGNNGRMAINNTGWDSTTSVWHALIGDPGSTKSHPVNFMMKPLKDWEAEKMKEYSSKLEAFKIFEAMNPKEQAKQRKASKYEIVKPIPEEIITNNTTVEALVERLQNNPNGMLIHKDELISLTKSLGQYKGGGGDDQEFFLEAFNGKDYKVARKGQELVYVNNICLSIIGTIQPEVLSKIPSENGMLHRFLFTQPVSEIADWSEDVVNQDDVDLYMSTMRGLIERTRNSEIMRYEKDKVKFRNMFNYFSKKMRDKNISNSHKEYYGKLKTYIPRLAIILNVIWDTFSEENEDPSAEIFDLVFDLMKYYEITGEMVFSDRNKNLEINSVIDAIKRKGMTNDEMIKVLNGKGFTQKLIAKKLGVSERTINRKIKKTK